MKPYKQKLLIPTNSQYQALSQYNSCKHIARKSSIQHSHLPISSNYSISVKKESKSNYIYESSSKHTNHKSSPYTQLPSVSREQNNQNFNYSNMSNRYYEGYNQLQRDSSGSIYDQFRLDERYKRPFQTEQSQLSNYYSEQSKDKDIRDSKNNQIETRRKQSFRNYAIKPQPQTPSIKQSNSQSRCSHKSPNFTKKSQINYDQEYYSVSHMNNSRSNDSLAEINKSQELIKKHINQKLDRVCEKINNLSTQKNSNCNQKTSRQEQYRSEQGTNVNWHKKDFSNDGGLCYSSIVYKKQDESTLTPKSSYKRHYGQEINHMGEEIDRENRIQQRISSLSQPSHQQFLQARLIQMDKKIVFANAKVLRLEEQLLQQRQKLIKKQKQWLMRENELLNWINTNQVQSQLMHGPQQSQSVGHTCKHNLVSIADNVIVDQSHQSHQSEIRQYERICDSLYKILKEMTKVFTVNRNWLTLMNRTLSHQLPGTAFRVKQQMNLNQSLFGQIEKQCLSKLIELSQADLKSHIPQRSTSLNPSLNFQPLSDNLFTNNPSLNTSEAYLLQSYCPPVSEQFQVQTAKHNLSSVKPCQKQKRSISCLSESKSVTSTNKKNVSISTHKKQVKEQGKPLAISKNNQKPSHSLYHSRKSQYYCNQVFYSRARQINSPLPQQNQLKHPEQLQSQTDSQLYYLLSLQALTIETLIPQPSVESTFDHEPEENLLSGVYA